MNNQNHDPRAHQRAAELQMDACLTELGGMNPDRSLATRILHELNNHDHQDSPVATGTSPSPWLVAALVFIGISVVSGIAYMRTPDEDNSAKATPSNATEDGDSGIQDPKATKTLIADYSNNQIMELDSDGRVVLTITDILGAWDVEALPNGNFLVTAFSISQVQELDRKGKSVWHYNKLKNPYSAQRLQNGNTLIANTFASEVIEVTTDHKVAWSFNDNIRPFDAELTDKGTILIADALADRVIEVDREKNIVWEAKGLPNAHDADRLPNGNTLVTLRNKGSVVELDAKGRTVWELTGLRSPSDADRLPNGNTLVAEKTQVREFDKNKQQVWKKNVDWATEINRYVR